MTQIASSQSPAHSQTSAACDMFAHTSIRASAGSGKTFQLTNRYLQLVSRGVEPSSILASTFTRLAAGEIRDRLLMRLADAADCERLRADLAQHLGFASLSRHDTLKLLAGLSRQLHLLQVRTLDSFFATIVKAFAIELGLPPNADVADDDQASAMRSSAIELMLDEHQPQKLVELLRLLTQGSTNRQITETIDLVVSNLHALFCETPHKAWECVPVVQGHLKPQDVINAINHLQDVALTSSGKLHDIVASDCAKARTWDWKSFISAGIAAPIANGKTQYGRTQIPVDLIQAYQPLVQHAIAELVSRARSQTLATRDLLAAFDAQLRIVKRRQNAVTFDDLAPAMSNAEHLGTLDEISFRLDARIHHLLLDEFQDTSVPQWRALEPIVREMISVAPPERTLLCVGDVKQSIYGWRDAAPEVLERLPQLLTSFDGSSAIHQHALTRSYRSSPIIMDVVNSVFSPLVSNPALSDHVQAAQSWSESFSHHDTAKTDLPGYCELRYCPTPLGGATDPMGKHDLRLTTAAQLAADLHRANPSISIALLTRANSAVSRLLYELGPCRLNVPVSGKGGGPLTDSAPVNVILDLLQLADHPDDTIAAFNVACSPAGELLQFRNFTDVPARRKLARSIRQSILNRGYGNVIAEWIGAFAPSCDARELRTLQRLLEFACSFDNHPSLRTRDFINIITESRSADFQPAPVQVMTIHQSKGLEFDAVILPELNSKILGSNGGRSTVVFERHERTGPISRICRWIPTDVREFVPELKPVFEQHCERCVRESLCLLYVAITRAKQGLYFILDRPRLKKDGEESADTLKTLGGIVRTALAPNALQSPVEPVYSHGDSHWFRPVESATQLTSTRSPVVQIESIELAAFAENGGNDATILRAWSTAPASTSASAHDIFALPDDEARERGLALHAMFQKIEWLESYAASDEELMQIAQQFAPRKGRAWAAQQVKDFRSMLARPAIRNLLSKPNEGDWTLYRERPFARLVESRLQSGIIDRLAISLNDRGKPLCAIIIDYKSDPISSSKANERAGDYRAQLETYRLVVAEQLRLLPEHVKMQVAFVVPGVVCDL